MSESKTPSASPKANNTITVRTFLTNQIDMLVGSGEKTQKQIAAEIGYTKPNIITMFKQGLTNLPINKVDAMARAIHADPVFLLRLVLSEYMPDSYETITRILGDTAVYSENEKSIIADIRKVTNGDDVVINTPRKMEAYRLFLESLK